MNTQEKIITAISLGSMKFLFIQVPTDAINFVVDNSMQFMVFKIPAYENWCPNDVLENPFEIQKWLKQHEGKDDFKTSGMKLPNGKFKLIGKADKLHKVDELYKKIIRLGLNVNSTLILEKI